MDIEHLIAELNPEQRQAVTSDHPRILCIAGAGAGKTKSLALRIVRLLASGTASERILAVTFTRAAAAEMRERVGLLLAQLGLDHIELPDVRTLHSWGAQLIRTYADHFGRNADFTIYDEHDHEDVVRACARDLGIKKHDTAKLATLWREERVQAEYQRRLLEGNALDYDMIESCTLKLLQEHPGAQDRWVSRYRHVLVDEYQDTNLAQVAIVSRLAPPNLFIVGDPRQSIYLFRGAEPATIVEAARSADYEVIELVANYRSVPEVIELANGCVDGDWQPMVAHRPAGRGDAVTTHQVRHQAPGVAELLHHLHDVDGYRWGDIYVLGRTWAAVHQVRELLEEQAVPHRYCGKETDPWATDDGRNLARMALLLRNPADANLVALLAEWGAVGVSRVPDLQRQRGEALRARRTLLQQLAEAVAPLDGEVVPAWRAIRDIVDGLRVDEHGELADGRLVADVVEGAIEAMGVFRAYTARDLVTRVATLRTLIDGLRKLQLSSLDVFASWWIERSQQDHIREAVDHDEVSLMTVHGSKGLEAPVVVMLDCYDGQYPSGRVNQSDEERRENLRIFYVGVTRARDRLLLVQPTHITQPWGGPIEPVSPSPYLARAGAPPPSTWQPETWGGALPSGW